jgi:hypothetical protein
MFGYNIYIYIYIYSYIHILIEKTWAVCNWKKSVTNNDLPIRDLKIFIVVFLKRAPYCSFLGG